MGHSLDPENYNVIVNGWFNTFNRGVTTPHNITFIENSTI